MTNGIAKQAGLPVIDNFSIPCPKCGAEMSVTDSTPIQRKTKGIHHAEGKCPECKYIIQSASSKSTDDAKAAFYKSYEKHKATLMSKPGAYQNKNQNLWSFAGKADVICITTNGATKRSGEAIMGRGCAKQASTRYPSIPTKLGGLLTEHGNRPFKLVRDLSDPLHPTWIVSFPVKPVYRVCRTIDEVRERTVEHMQDQMIEKLNGSDRVIIPGWACKAEISQIEKSAQQLMDMATKFGWKKIVCPRPGAGADELNWQLDVKPVLDKILDQRFVIVTYPRQE